jgi:hypothetical protein
LHLQDNRFMFTSLIALLMVAILILSIMVNPTVIIEGQLQQQQSPQELGSDTNRGLLILSSSVITDFGSTYVVGEVRNDLPSVVESVQVLARFYDASGRLIDTGSANAELSQLRPGEKSPFRLSVTDDESVVQRIANYNLTVDWDVVSGDAKPAALRIIEGEQRINGTDETYEILGEVVNMGSDDTTSVKVVATLYDEIGKIIDTAYTYSEPSDFSEVLFVLFDFKFSC